MSMKRITLVQNKKTARQWIGVAQCVQPPGHHAVFVVQRSKRCISLTVQPRRKPHR